jgi:hypothetical protein
MFTHDLKLALRPRMQVVTNSAPAVALAMSEISTGLISFAFSLLFDNR